MINLLRKLWSGPAKVLSFDAKEPERFQLCTKDDFGPRWRELMVNGELPRGMTEEKLVEFLLSFRDASMLSREFELRHLLHHISLSELRHLSELWWVMVVRTSWLELSIARLGCQPSAHWEGYSFIAGQNLLLAHGIMALHLHLQQRIAMKDLPYFIVDCERRVPRLGKASPYLWKAARQLQRTYSILPKVD